MLSDQGVLPLISLEGTLHPPSGWLWNQPELVLADLAEIILTPEEAAAANSSLETQTSPDTGARSTERLLGLSQGWLCPPQILLFSYKIMWETTYLGNLCDFIKYFKQSWAALGGLNGVNQWAFLIIANVFWCAYLSYEILLNTFLSGRIFLVLVTAHKGKQHFLPQF